jgi:hypothetical protein
MERIIDYGAINKVARDLHPEFKRLGSEWYQESIILCLRHDGECAYCGLDLLSSHGICYHLWCLDHLLPQAKYPGLKDHPENHILACKPCNSIKGAFDPNKDTQIDFGTGELTIAQRTQLLQIAKAHVGAQKTGLEAVFKEQLKLLRPYIKRLTA